MHYDKVLDCCDVTISNLNMIKIFCSQAQAEEESLCQVAQELYLMLSNDQLFDSNGKIEKRVMDSITILQRSSNPTVVTLTKIIFDWITNIH